MCIVEALNVCVVVCAGLRAGGGARVGAVLRAERPVAHRPNVPVLARRLHRPLHVLHRPQPQVARARRQDLQPQRVPHIRRL